MTDRNISIAPGSLDHKDAIPSCRMISAAVCPVRTLSVRRDHPSAIRSGPEDDGWPDGVCSGFLQRFAGVGESKGARLVLADDAERRQGAKQTMQSVGIGGALVCEAHCGAWSKSEFVSKLQARRGADYPTVHEAHRHLDERLAVIGKHFLRCAR